MKKIIGTSLAVLAFAAFGTSEAKADAIGFASLQFTQAGFFDSNGNVINLTTAVTPINIRDNLTESSSLNGVNAPGQNGSRSNSTDTVDPVMSMSGNYSGGQNNFGFTAANTNFSRSDTLLTGSVLAGNAVSSTVAEVQVNGTNHGSADGRSEDNSSVQFTATTNESNITFDVAGMIAAYASAYNSTNLQQSGDAKVTFTVSLVDNGTTGSGNTSVLSFDPAAFNTQVAANFTGQTAGTTNTTTPVTAVSNPFDLIAGHIYTLQIVQEVSADAISIPEPGSLAVFGAGLLLLGGLTVARRRKEGFDF